MDRLPEPLPKLEWVLLTPELADELLLKNTHNRRATEARIEQMTRDMTDGNFHWQAGAKVMVAATGELLDGQKTCMAVVRSGRAQPVILITDVEPDSWAFIDNGQPRQFWQELARDGVENANAVAGATRALWQGLRAFPIGGRNRPSMSQLKALYDERGRQLRERAVDGMRISQRLDFGSPSILAAIMVLAYDRDYEGAAAFFTRLEAGDRAWGSPEPVAQLLRKLDGLAKDARKSRRGPDTVQGAAWVVRGFNAFRLGDDRTLTNWKPGIQPFPVILTRAEVDAILDPTTAQSGAA